MADKNKSGDFYNRPEKLGAWAGFKQFLWNSETSQFMGRTSSSWGKSYTGNSFSSILKQKRLQKRKKKVF